MRVHDCRRDRIVEGDRGILDNHCPGFIPPRNGSAGNTFLLALFALLGQYDFSEEKLQGTVGVRPPKLTPQTGPDIGSWRITLFPLDDMTCEKSGRKLRSFAEV